MVGKGTEAGTWGSWPILHPQSGSRQRAGGGTAQSNLKASLKGLAPPARLHLLKLPLSSKTSGDQVPNTKASEWVSFTFKPQHSSYPVRPYHPEKEAGRLHHSEVTRVLWLRGVILNNKDLRDLMPSLMARSLASASLWNVPALNPAKVLIHFWQAASVSACLLLTLEVIPSYLSHQPFSLGKVTATFKYHSDANVTSVRLSRLPGLYAALSLNSGFTVWGCTPGSLW